MAKFLGITLLSLALAGCAFAPPAADPARFSADSLFAPPSRPVDPDQVFAVSGAMRAYIEGRVESLQGSRSRQRALIDALRAKDELKLEYDAAYTRKPVERLRMCGAPVEPLLTHTRVNPAMYRRRTAGIGSSTSTAGYQPAKWTRKAGSTPT